MTASPKVVIVGGGPIGALSALYAARRGCQVDLYDLRDDPNYGDLNARPAIAVIPISLSERGIRAIEGSNTPGLLEGILDGSKPIYTRMVHTRDKSGQHKNIPMAYGPQGQCLYSIEREKLTKHCMMALLKEPKATMHFNQRLMSCDFDQNIATFEAVARTDEELDGPERKSVHASHSMKVPFDFIIGADGTYSSVRQSIMRKSHMNFSQEYVHALWCDFIFSARNGDYPLDSKCIHIWPADQRFVMAQPDFNNTFRAGLVCDTVKVRHLEAHPEEFAPWFSNEFPGIIPELISAEEATCQFIRHQKIPLKSVKTGNLGFKDSAVLLGDSSHAMTPFHAMGMITGLEDVRIFFEDFVDARLKDQKINGHTKEVFCTPGTIRAYEENRIPDVHAMVDMASDHYHELRVGVRSPAARAKKIVEAYLSRRAPWLGWTTAYARIQFGHERFTVVREKEARQTTTIKAVLWTAVAGFSSCAIMGMYRLMH